MSPAEPSQSRTVAPIRARRSRAMPAPAASPEALQPFCGFAAAMADLARRPGPSPRSR
ncbi:hypothetical protein [Solimonas fluminis]|uniref:hypothetical protein n=1 Tax=Solimonas fluminis TaxID=2086571 RepID=UPI0013FD638E|nr:hypothetical protein [Solimonas fluminis]